MTDQTTPNSAVPGGWRKSSYSDPNGGSCVEVLDDHPAGVPVRDSKQARGPALVFSTGGWTSFVEAVKGDNLAV